MPKRGTPKPLTAPNVVHVDFRRKQILKPLTDREALHRVLSAAALLTW